VDTPDEPQNKGMSELSLFSRQRGWTVVEFPERRARAGTRPVFSQMMYRVWRRKFDVVLVESLDCFAHSMADLAEKVSLLHRAGIRFIAAGEGIDIDPETVAGRESFRTLTVYAKSESKMIARSVRAGIAKAQSYGVKCGRPRRHFALAEARKLREQGLSFSAISARIGVPASTIADGLRKPGGRR